MDEQLIKQVEILAGTVKLATDRMEQACGLLLDQINKLNQMMDSLQITNDALRKSLSESDNQIDDLAKVTAALLRTLQELSEPGDETAA